MYVWQTPLCPPPPSAPPSGSARASNNREWTGYWSLMSQHMRSFTSTKGAVSPEHSLLMDEDKRLKTEVQTSCHAEFVRMSIKRVICVYALLTKISNIFFQCMDMCILCVSKKSLIEQYENTPYSPNITNNVSTVLLC